MTKKIVFLFILLLATPQTAWFWGSFPAFAQDVDTAWVRTYNGPANGSDWARAIAVDGSGNVYVTGYSWDSGTDDDYATIKYAPDGTELWVRTYDGTGNDMDQANAIAVDGAGNVYVTGRSRSSGSNLDWATIKYDLNGTELWVAPYNGDGNGTDEAVAIAVDGAGNVYVAGQSRGSVTYEFTTIKYDQNGTELWVETYSGPGNLGAWAWDMTIDGAGNVYVTGGSVGSGTGDDFATIMYDTDGNQQWAARYNGPANGDDVAKAIAIDNVFDRVCVAGYSFRTGNAEDYAIIWYDLGGNELQVRTHGGPDWDEACAIAVTEGHVCVTGKMMISGSGYDFVSVFYDPSMTMIGGPTRYNGPGNSDDLPFAIAVDSCYNFYVTGLSVDDVTNQDYATIKYSLTGYQHWVERYNGPGGDGNDVALDIAADASSNVYVTGKCYGSGLSNDYCTIKYVQPPRSLILIDGQGDPIVYKGFEIYKVDNNPPTMTETYLGTLPTDADGKITLPEGWFNIGDWIKVEKLLKSELAVKHPSILPFMWHIKIDNGQFNPNTGEISYHTLTCAEEQVDAVGHTTVMYDLLVSVEWDAPLQYLENLLEGFRLTSNYLYDVTDGQLYLNTVRIFDNRVNWSEADVQIYADNTFGPAGQVKRTNIRRGGGIYLSSQAYEPYLYLPRIRYFNDADANRNLTFDPGLWPYDWTIDETSYDFDHDGTIEPWEYRAYAPSRCLAHEFGHYGIGFMDEWKDASRNPIFPDYDFGFMDYPYTPGVDQCSEMSCTDIQYLDPSHQITHQWTERGDRSCWDYFEWNFEGRYPDAPYGTFAPISPPTTQMFAGPNDDMQNLNYDVGSLIPLAGAINDFVGGAEPDVLVIVYDSNDDPHAGADVTLHKIGRADMEQGQTADPPWEGMIRCLGYEAGDVVDASDHVLIAMPKTTQGWLFGQGVLGTSGVSNFRNTYRTSSDGDTLHLFLRAVQGDYPLIFATSLSSETSEYVLTATHMFSTNPTVELHPDDEPEQSYLLESTPTGYSVVIPDDIGSSGRFTLLAVDDSAYTFFVHTPYSLAQIIDTAFVAYIIGPQGGCELSLDTLNSDLDKVLILSSPYPPIRTGLHPQSEQAGEVYSLSSYPSGTLLGSNSLVIYYADSDLQTQSEATLEMFKWNESLQEWEELCGFVDTLENVIGASIEDLGVYAAFTAGYLRGDASGDGVINSADVVFLINYLFKGGPPPEPWEAAEANCDGVINSADVVYLINYLFKGGSPPKC